MLIGGVDLLVLNDIFIQFLIYLTQIYWEPVLGQALCWLVFLFIMDFIFSLFVWLGSNLRGNCLSVQRCLASWEDVMLLVAFRAPVGGASSNTIFLGLVCVCKDRILPCIMRPHVFGPKFQGKKIFYFNFLTHIFICLYLGTCFLYDKGNWAFFCLLLHF